MSIDNLIGILLNVSFHPIERRTGMIRELKSLSRLHSLLVLELEKHAEFQQITPELSLLPAPDKTGCNWGVRRWSGPSDRVAKAVPALNALTLLLQKRYMAIIVRV